MKKYEKLELLLFLLLLFIMLAIVILKKLNVIQENVVPIGTAICLMFLGISEICLNKARNNN